MALTLQQVRTLPETSGMSDNDIINHAKSIGLDTTAMVPEVSNEEGDIKRGFNNTFRQLPQIGYGLTAIAGATGENLFGEGGISTGIKKAGLAGYKEASATMEEHSKPSDSLSYSWDRAKEGHFGDLADWVQHGIGYAGGQGLQLIATAGFGNLAAKEGAKAFAQELTAKMVASEAAKIGATDAAKVAAEKGATAMTADAIQQAAVKNVASKIGTIGANTAMGGMSLGMEGGEIGGDLATKAQERGTPLTGKELAQGFGATLGAGALEFVGDKFGLDVLTGKSKLYKALGSAPGLSGRVGRGVAAGAIAGIPEAATEYGQTLTEEYGKGNDPFSAESKQQAFDAAGQGAVGGHVMGFAGGLLSAAKPKTPEQLRAEQLKAEKIKVDLVTTATTGTLGNALATGGFTNQGDSIHDINQDNNLDLRTDAEKAQDNASVIDSTAVNATGLQGTHITADAENNAVNTDLSAQAENQNGSQKTDESTNETSAQEEGLLNTDAPEQSGVTPNIDALAEQLHTAIATDNSKQPDQHYADIVASNKLTPQQSDDLITKYQGIAEQVNNEQTNQQTETQTQDQTGADQSTDVAFQPTHELNDGTQVQQIGDNTYVDQAGDEWGADDAKPIGKADTATTDTSTSVTPSYATAPLLNKRTNKPFKTRKMAEAAIASSSNPTLNKQDHIPVPVDGGFGIAPKPNTTQESNDTTAETQSVLSNTGTNAKGITAPATTDATGQGSTQTAQEVDKQPWQMTHDEYWKAEDKKYEANRLERLAKVNNELDTLKNKGEGYDAIIAKEIGKVPHTITNDGKFSHNLRSGSYKHNNAHEFVVRQLLKRRKSIESSSGRFRNSFVNDNKNHHAAIQKAIDEGQSIPKNVLESLPSNFPEFKSDAEAIKQPSKTKATETVAQAQVFGNLSNNEQSNKESQQNTQSIIPKDSKKLGLAITRAAKIENRSFNDMPGMYSQGSEHQGIDIHSINQTKDINGNPDYIIHVSNRTRVAANGHKTTEGKYSLNALLNSGAISQKTHDFLVNEHNQNINAATETNNDHELTATQYVDRESKGFTANKQINDSLRKAHYTAIRSHLDQGGKISQEVFDSLDGLQRSNLNKNYGEDIIQSPAQEVAKKPDWEMTRDEYKNSFDPRDYKDSNYDRMIRGAVFNEKITQAEADKKLIRDYHGNKYHWAKTRKELEQEKKEAVKNAKAARAEGNKNPIHSVKWAQKSESNTAKNNITSTNLYHNKLLEVHQERVQEALSEGKPVPQEVLADYPNLQKPAQETANPINDNADVSKKGENVDTYHQQTIDEFLSDAKKELGADFDGLKPSLINEHYQSIEDHIKDGGKISQAVYDSLETGKQHHFNKTFGAENVIDDGTRQAELDKLNKISDSKLAKDNEAKAQEEKEFADKKNAVALHQADETVRMAQYDVDHYGASESNQLKLDQAIKSRDALVRADNATATENGNTAKPEWHIDIPEQGLAILPAELKGEGYRAVAGRIAKDAVEAITQNQKIANDTLYLYFLPAAENYNAIARYFPEDQKPGGSWQIADSQGVRAGSLTNDQLLYKTESIMGNKPILGWEKTSTDAVNVIGKGNSGDVTRIDNEVEKNATGNEAKVYELLKGVEGVAKGYEHDGKIRLPFYEHIISIDTIPKDDRESLGSLVSKNKDRIISAVNSLTNIGYDYNDPLQFGMNKDQQFDLLDFSMAENNFPKEVRNNNLNRLSSFFKQFGAEKIGKAISHVANVLIEQKFQAQYPDMAYTTHEGIDYPALTERLGGKVATHAYYATNARYIQLKDTGIAQTELVNGIKVILSNHAISESDIKQWEMTPVVYGSTTKQEKVAQAVKPALGKYIQPKATASSEDQKRLANRGSRIATLSGLNDAIRKSNPDDAYSDSEIQSAADEKIDEGIDWLISKQQPTKKLTTKGTVIADKAESNIQDFGEKLEGAKKFTYTFKEALADDIDISSVPLSKSFPQPDYDKLIAGGIKPQVAALIAQLRAEIPTKPSKSYRVSKWAAQVTAIREAADSLLSGDLTVEQFITIGKGTNNYTKYMGDVLAIADSILPSQIRELGNFKLDHTLYRLYSGVKDVWKWSVVNTASKSSWGKQFDSKEEAIAYIKSEISTENTKGESIAKFDRWTERDKPGVVFVGKKIASGKYIALKAFSTSKEALDYTVEHNAELVALLKQKKKDKEVRRAENNQRVGKDYRNGKNVSAKEFTETFGFRGVQFGNWVENDRRQQDLNNAYDGLIDLAEVLGIPPKALALNGELGLAFGARGTGGEKAAAAHYEPNQVVINLTKAHGAGSLAHEWWHAVDNYFGKQEGSGFLSEAYSGRNPYQVRQEVYQAWTGITDTIKKETKLAKRSAIKDKTKTKDYWSTVIEMTARTFERYIIGKLADQGYENDYLANIIPAPILEKENELDNEDYAYPLQSEMAAVNKAYDKLFAVLETKETDKGTALFSKSTTPVVNPHSKTSLNQAVTKAMDTLFGQGWTNRLMATGKFKMISAAEATGLIGKNAMFHKVWHGSPHDHNGFDSANIGTGEGAQAFGWGHYFSDAKKIAEWYRDKLSFHGGAELYYSNEFDRFKEEYPDLGNEFNYWARESYHQHTLSNGDVGALLRKVIANPRNNFLTSNEEEDQLINLNNKIKDTNFKVKEYTYGKLYEVDLAPSQDEYLDWDKPLSEQSDVVKAGLKELHKQLEGDLLNEYLDRINADWSELTGQELYQKILQRSHQDGLFDHPDIYDRSVPDDEASSHLLHSLGIRGIRYKAEAGQSDANNYVVFNDADVKIEVKYSKNGDVIAFYNPANDTTYLVHDNITQNTSDKALQGLMLHEIGVHALTLGKSNEAFKDILRRFEALKKTNPKVQAAFDRVPKDTKAEDIVEEALAYYLEENPRSSLAQRIVEWFRQAVRALGKTLPVLERAKFSQWANKLTEAELIGMATSALKSAPDSLQFDNVGRNREGIKLSQSAMKSVFANIKRGREAMTQALLNKSTVHRAMFRQGMGWVDFEWGSEGGKITTKGKRPGAKGIAHIIEARQRKDGLNAKQTESLLFDLVDTIAKGEETDRYSYGNVENIKIQHNNKLAFLTHKQGNNAWIVTGFELDSPDNGKTGNDVLPSTRSESTLTRNEVGAGTQTIAQQENNSSNSIKFSRSTPSNTPADNSAMRSFFAPAKGKQALGWLAGLFQRNHLIDFVAKDLPELINYKLLSQEKDNFTNQRENEIGKSYKEMMDKMDKKTMHELGRVQGMATRLVKFDPALADDNTPMTEEELAVYDAYTAMPDTAKEVYATMRDAYQADLMEKKRALIERIKAFPADRETQAKIIKTIEKHFDQFKEGVYFPLNRDGAVIVKATNADGDLVIEHVATQADAYKLIKEMQDQGYENTHILGKDAYDRDLLAGNAANEMAALAHRTISDLKEKSVQGKLTDADFNDLFSEFNQLLINTLPDSSYRKHFIHRKGTLGESTDTLRAYAKTRTSAVKMIASLTYDHQIQAVLNDADKTIKEMDKVPGSDTLAIKSILNELKLREAALKSTEINAMSQVLTSLGFMGALGFNIGSAAVNMLQVMGAALPELSGRHGEVEAMKEIASAYKLLFNPATLNRSSGFDVTKNPNISDITKQAIERLKKIGKIDLTMTHDAIAMGKNPSYSSNLMTRSLGSAAKYSGYFFHVAEAANRQITGMAAFNLAYQKNGGNFEAAIAEAVDVIDRTQFDYGQGNRARYMMSNTARVLTLFKAYALGMSYYIGRNAYQSMKGETPEVRLQARKTLVVSMAMSFATAGLFGMPIGIEAFAGIGGVAAFKYKGAYFAVPGAIGGMLIFRALLEGLGADDDDELETEFRNWLTDNFDQTTAEWVTKGPARLLPIGDISGRTSLSELWWRSQNKQLEGTDQYNAIATALIGPIGSQIAGLFTAKKMYEDGQYSRMVESMSPAFMRNAIAATRMSQDGVRNLKGDKIIERDLTPVELINKVIGFNPTVVTNTYDANSAIAKESTKHTLAKSHLVNRWLSGDATERSDLMKGDIKDFNESVSPSERITLKNLFASMKARKGIDKHTQNGLYLSKKQNYLRDIGRFNRQE